MPQLGANSSRIQGILRACCEIYKNQASCLCREMSYSVQSTYRISTHLPTGRYQGSPD